MDPQPKTYNLEERTFGLPDSLTYDKDKTQPPIQSTPFCITECIAVYMFPLIVTVVLCLITVWSIHRSIEYSELFQTNNRYKWAMMTGNVIAVVVCSALTLYAGKGVQSVHYT
jgi:hypothetical protein